MRRLIVLTATAMLALTCACSSTTETDAPSPAATSTGDPPVPGTSPPKKDAGGVPTSVTPGFDAGIVSECTPPANAGEIYAFSEMNLAGSKSVPLCSFRDRVMLIVNTASKCGNTPQYAPLQSYYEEYRDQGLIVLGFPCNQFGGQESGTSKDISEFCTNEYGITFPMFSKIEVNGSNANPLYVWLKAQPGGAGDIEWNFAKFLVGRDGKLIKRYAANSDPGVEPLKSQITADIKAALAK